MPTVPHILLLAPLLSIAAGAFAHAAPEEGPLQVVQVKASATAYDPRRDDTAAKIVVTHDEIVKQGDTSIGDVLKRLPGITIGGVPGRGGDIKMRGMGSGYTQILLNGDPAPPGFSLDGLAPDLIERIEIMRAASAEYSTQAIAGTINIVLRRAVVAAQRELKTTLQSEHGRPGGNANFSVSDKAGNLSYAVVSGLAWSTQDRPATGFTTFSDPAGAPLGRRDQASFMRGTYQGVNLAPRVNLTLGPDDSLAWQSFLAANEYGGPATERSITTLGAPPAFSSAVTSLAQRTVLARSDLTWTHKMADGARFDAKAGVSTGTRRVEREAFEYDRAATLALERRTTSRPRDQGVSASVKYATPVFGKHALTAGWDGAWSARTEHRIERDIAAGDPPANLNLAFDASVVRLALFAQDEWTISKQWSAYLGLRWEGVRTRSSGVENTSAVWSPLLQTLYKLPGSKQDQVRLALSRTYKAPFTNELLPRRLRAIENSATTPDEQGNPRLRPELAWGLDLAFEHYLQGGGLLSASAYLRRIEDNARNNIFLIDGLWVSMPINTGKAQAHGIELEAKFALKSVFKAAPAIDLRANLARNWSRLDTLPGPNNRLVSQTPVSANLGVDYKMDRLPLTLGASYSYQNGGPVRFSLNEFDYSTPKRLLDLYALARISPKVQLRLSVANALHQSYMTALTWVDADGARADATITPTAPVLRAALELKL
ncbi:TonB-dependent receptor plug domain-containing protein [Massilia sp. S19_KUP03_FR1]|uniref:TonB-dependent receptor plug domain-containing protein n=1 Tax=Massilia sp. S19_KUP03_FR1 TaxID=3025503 RepID=UPI002FCD98E6